MAEALHFIADAIGYAILTILFITLSATLPDLICAAWRSLRK